MVCNPISLFILYLYEIYILYSCIEAVNQQYLGNIELGEVPTSPETHHFTQSPLQRALAKKNYLQ